MTNRPAHQQRIEAYLSDLRLRLRALRAGEIEEIIKELRSHVLDKAAATGNNVEVILGSLGSPKVLASQYLADDVLARAEASHSPFRLLESLFRWAALSVAGFFVLLGTIVGYFLGGAFVFCALLKPFHPQTVGLWLLPAADGDTSLSLRLGFTGPPPGARELLGWWIVPMGLAVGGLLVWLTTRFALWCVRRYRSSRVLPSANPMPRG